jgi:ornithine cyclodeaminase/alanine dehydrogenase-like protein (mu-crystallin family)
MLPEGAVLWLNARDVRELMDLPALVGAIREVFVQYGRGKVASPPEPRIAAEELGSEFAAFSSYVPGVGGYAVKVLARNLTNPERGLPFIYALVTLVRPETGEPLAVMDGAELTGFRTAATSAVATDALARRDAKVLGILGTGLQARMHLAALPIVRAFESVLICSPSGARERAEALAAQAPSSMHGRVEAVDAVDEVVRQADVLVTTTIAQTPLFKAALVPPGAHVVVIGPFKPFGSEIEPAICSRARYVVSDRASRFVNYWTNARPGELQIEPAVLERVLDLADVLDGRAPVERRPDDITLFDSIGMAMEDTVAAKLVYERAIATGRGQRLE